MRFFDLLLHGAGRLSSSAGFGPNEAAVSATDDIAQQRRIVATRSAMYELLRFVDEVCLDNSIGYFLYSETLQGAVNYRDFVPGSAKVHLGMVREDYDRFESIVSPLAEQRGYRFESTQGRFGNVFRRMPLLCMPVSDIPLGGGEQCLAPDGSAATTFVSLKISVFDSVPDSPDVRKGHLRRMRRLNRRNQRISDARAVLRRERPIRNLGHLWRVLWNLPRLRAYSSRRLIKQAQRYNGQGMAQVTRLAGPRTAIVDRERLAPYGRIAFGPLELNCPNEPSVWAVDVANEDMSGVLPLQQNVKRILVEFDRVCRQIGVGYFICGGTMLGYVRHGGFIPWDDDMDVAMLRADYDRFRAEAGPLLGEEFFLQTRESDPNIPYLFTKIRLNGTEYITSYNEHRNFHKGICLDIFPFDAIPNGDQAQQRFYEKVNKRARAHHRVVNRQVPSPIYEKPPRDLEERWFRLFGRVHRWVFWHIPLTWTQSRYIRLVTKYNGRAESDGLECVASFTPSYTYIRLDELLPYRDVEFEDITVKVPQCPEVFLKMQYGDYLRLPPMHKRIGHRLLRWSDMDAERENPTTDM